MGVGTVIGRWAVGIALAGAVALAVGCGGDDPPEQARDLTPASTSAPTATATPQRTMAPTATRTPTSTPTGGSLSSAICSLNGTCPTATATATAPPPPPPRSPTPTVLRSPSPSPGPALTTGQLGRALLTEYDLGRDWAEFDSGVLAGERHPAVFAEFAGPRVDQYLVVELHDERTSGAIATEFIAVHMIADRTFATLDQVSPTGPGEDRIRYRYEFVEDGDRLYGEVVAWRQGTVVAAIMAEGPSAETCVCDLAQRQSDKLRATIQSIR